jgi:TetR/AcrR family transcriptional regulator, cholesterol catabolism regulator
MTRTEILEAAASIFGERGYHAASMQDIANAVNLQKASLYHHFSGKQEILLALLDAGLDMLINEMEQVISKPMPPEEKIRSAMVGYLQTMIKFQDLSAVLLLEYRSLDPALRSSHITRRDYFENLWRKLIEEGTNSGAFKCADPSITSKAILGVLNWTITWYQQGGKDSPTKIGNEYASLFLEGLLVRG